MRFVLALKAVGARPWSRRFLYPYEIDCKSKSVKNRAYCVPTQRIYASGGVFEPRAERACLVQPRDAVARSLKSTRHCLLVEGVDRSGGAGASQSAYWLRANRTPRHGLWRATGRGAALPADSSADVGFSTALPGGAA